jgi:hypothetical protein
MGYDMRCEESSDWALGEHDRIRVQHGWLIIRDSDVKHGRTAREVSRGSRNSEVGLQGCQDGRNDAMSMYFA